MPAKNDDAVCLRRRAASFAGKPRSNSDLSHMLEPGLPAKNDDAQFCGTGFSREEASTAYHLHRLKRRLPD